MELVVDSNVLISSLVKSIRCRDLLCSPKLVLYAPEQIILESLAHKEEILEKSGIDNSDFAKLIAILLSRINIIPEAEFSHLTNEALKLVTHSEDAPFIALSLSRGIPIWSEDKALKRQSLIKIFSTEELIKLLSKEE
jgi:predicted nucleic acid-binding protein